MASPSRAIYVHLPWCVRKCPYCDFNSHQRDPNAIPEDEYINALIKDIEAEKSLLGRLSSHSVFFGGGTPSLFSANGIARILSALNDAFPFTTDAEITLEANPGTFEQAKFRGYAQAGVNRLSLGIQSFDDDKLAALGRIHGSLEAKRAIGSAREVGFDNFNIDIMHGLPQQSVDEALADLACAAEFAPSHLSWYQLTIETNTAFYSNPPVLPDIDALDDIEVAGFELLQSHGFEQYEVSAWARDGAVSRHNLSYWNYEDYIGLGAGAHGKYSQGNAVRRRQKTRRPEDYMTHLKVKDFEVPSGDKVFEFFLNRLRLFSPVTQLQFEQTTGTAFETISDKLRLLKDQGLITLNPKGFELTYRGQRFLNHVQSQFLPENE
ncbi:radical SAM family heme chaperone HemW [uncultured Umboniibacter sp.]|uniref:radical SAM family heme chaperone HemW n=1 Tax=uncultured Umboniibacter sp. TaxID=1798917 RepID=UPI00261D32E6|nr:radical SAM family heme chaperone HemW [uncultured Umboniibacter sp.]